METNLSTKDLRAFLALSQTRNFGQTALQLHTSQSALSALIARLEEQLGARLFEEMLQRMPDIDAIFFCNDDIAQGGLLAAHRLGVQVPARIAMAGFNDLAGSDQMVPSLTTVRTPRSEVGREGAAMLLGMMRGSAAAPGSIELGYELVV
ncbi:MAG: substrate-binding domain-containing protein, partial [Comamonas sp.]